MLPKLASVAHVVITLITRNEARPLKVVEGSGARMTMASMPNRCKSNSGEESLLQWGNRLRWNGVEVAGATAANDLVPGLEVLNRETKRVKFNRDDIITSELTNKYEVLNERGNMSTLFKMKLDEGRQRWILL
jgi:hypothetical protein